MKLVKKIGIGCGSLLLLVVVSIGSLYFFLQAKQKKYDALTEPFFAEFIPRLVTWDPDQSSPYWTPELLEKTTPTQLKQLYAAYSQLGALRSYDTPQFQKISANTNIPYSSMIDYGVHAYFENGAATLSFQLVPTKDGAIKIWGLYINSEAFLPKVEPPTPTPREI